SLVCVRQSSCSSCPSRKQTRAWTKTRTGFLFSISTQTLGPALTLVSAFFSAGFVVGDDDLAEGGKGAGSGTGCSHPRIPKDTHPASRMVLILFRIRSADFRYNQTLPAKDEHQTTKSPR